MKLRLSLTLLVAALAAPAVAPAQAPAAQQDWSRTIVATAEGGFRIGNPDAPVKLVEYASLTCPHCAEFATQSRTSLIANHVRYGRVSFEFRNYILNGFDVTASLLARCAGPAGFFTLTERMLETQAGWYGRIQGISDSEKQRIMALPQDQAFVAVAEAGGLIELAAQAGVAPEQGRTCLGDGAAVGQLEQMAAAAEALGVQGTPTFFLNGARLEVNTWPEIEPLLGG